MSPVGHSLVGLAFAAFAFPESRDLRFRTGLAIVFVAFANLPDWPIPHWGHDRYDISHSIYVNITLIALALLIRRFTSKLKTGMTLSCMLLAAGAWFSHLLLDSFYNHGRGVGIYWPFSDGKLNFAMPWFNTLDLSQSITSRHNLMVYAIEFFAYFPVLVVAWLIAATVRRNLHYSHQENAV